MRKHLVVLLVGILVMAFAPVAVADGHGGGTYLALGDSVAAGTQQPAPFTDNGYTDNLFEHLEDEYGFDDFVNLACPGEDTAEMMVAAGGPTSDGSNCYGAGAPLPPGGTSQLDAAVAYLLSNPGEVELITISMGANDILACDLTDPEPVLNACLFAQLGQIGANLPVIVGTLQAVAPGVPIVAMNLYNPFLAFWLTGPAGQALAATSQAGVSVTNGTLGAVYGFFGVPVVDVATVFKTDQTGSGDPPQNVRAVCRWTLMCEKSGSEYVLSDWDPVTPGPQTDIHPSNKGYKRIAGAHADLIDALGLL